MENGNFDRKKALGQGMCMICQYSIAALEFWTGLSAWLLLYIPRFYSSFIHLFSGYIVLTVIPKPLITK
ncbi:hypothetical protein BJ912DRAFT_943230 [Pholiota molesta]|nr:hypothetical protein BJ912DRAFT_943230 [Pholiota molesta]